MKNNSVKINLTFVGDKTVQTIPILLASINTKNISNEDVLKEIKRSIYKNDIVKEIKRILIKDFENQLLERAMSDIEEDKRDSTFDKIFFPEFELCKVVKIVNSIDGEPRFITLTDIKSILIETEDILHYIEIDRKDIMNLLTSVYEKIITKLLISDDE